MNEPQVNVDHVYHRPTHHMTGLLSDQSDLPALVTDLSAASIKTEAVEVLCGERGAEILDRDGTHHGLRTRIIRTFQNFGYDANTLALYDEALHRGQLLLRIPVSPPDKDRVADLLKQHHVGNVGYFDTGSFEQF